MEEPLVDRSERFLHFSQRSLVALLVVVVVLGATALSLMLSPPGAVASSANLAWWLLPVAIAALVAVPMSLQRRRWTEDAPEVKAVMQDEWRRMNRDRASRSSLIVVLVAQWPLGLAFGFLDLPQPRVAFAMAAATITLGLVTWITLFLYLDRD